MTGNFGFGISGGGILTGSTAPGGFTPLIGETDADTGEQIFIGADGEVYVAEDVTEADPETGRIFKRKRYRKLGAGRRAYYHNKMKAAGGNAPDSSTFGGVILETVSVAGNLAMGALVSAQLNNETVIDRLQVAVVFQPNAAALTTYGRHLRFTQAPTIQTEPMFDGTNMVVPFTSAGPKWSSVKYIKNGAVKIPASTNIFGAGQATMIGGTANESYVVLYRLLKPGEPPET